MAKDMFGFDNNFDISLGVEKEEKSEARKPIPTSIKKTRYFDSGGKCMICRLTFAKERLTEDYHHKDGNPANNHLDNLRWDTRKNNAADRVRHGTTCRGERGGNAKLKETEVLEMRALWATGVRQKVLAKRFHVSVPLVSLIVNRHCWTHI